MSVDLTHLNKPVYKVVNQFGAWQLVTGRLVMAPDDKSMAVMYKYTGDKNIQISEDLHQWHPTKSIAVERVEDDIREEAEIEIGQMRTNVGV